MLPSGHFAAGYLVTTALIKIANANLSTSQVGVVTLVGTLSGIAPDIDLAYYFFRQKKGKLKKDENHRFYLTHAPLLWLLLSLGIYQFGGTEFWHMIGLSVWAGSWSHFVLDSIEFGVPWLWPMSKKLIALKRMSGSGNKSTEVIKSQWEFITKVYPTMVTSSLEILIIALALITFLTPHISASSLN